MNARMVFRDLVVVLALVGAGVWGVTRWLAVPWAVDGTSMLPTLKRGDRVLVDLWTLRRRPPRTGEIVLLVGPAGEPLVKRIAREPYPGEAPLPAPALQPNSPLEPAYVVLGDNAPESRDSRVFGKVPRHRIRGHVVWRYWPPSDWGPIE